MSGWQVSHAYTVRAAMSHVRMVPPQRPHFWWLYTYLYTRGIKIFMVWVLVHLALVGTRSRGKV